MLDSREKERERRIVLLRFGFNGEERKKNVFCIILSKRWRNLISWRQDHSLEHPVLKTSWLASKVRSSARRRRWERKQREEQYRTFLTSLRYQDLPSCSCDSRSIQHSLNIVNSFKNWTWRTRREELVPYLSFPQSSTSSASQENRICQKINARKNIFAYYELPKTHRALVGDDDVRDSDVTLALQGFLHHKTKILLPHLTTPTVDMLLMVSELYWASACTNKKITSSSWLRAFRRTKICHQPLKKR